MPHRLDVGPVAALQVASMRPRGQTPRMRRIHATRRQHVKPFNEAAGADPADAK